VQLYVRHLPQQGDRPKKELKGFQRVTLAPGEERTVTFPIKAASLAWWNTNEHRFATSPGQVQLMVGSSSADIRGEATLQITP
jgi:beta-glucosidase